MSTRKKVLIIGASSGIGAALAKKMAGDGYDVCIAARRTHLLDAIAAGFPGRITSLFLDVSEAFNEDKLEALDNRFRDTDIVVIAAGVALADELSNSQSVSRTIQTNISSFAAVFMWSYRLLTGKKNGHIVVLTSIAGLRGGVSAPVYNASKAFQISLIQSFHKIIAKSKSSLVISDIRVGYVETDLTIGKKTCWIIPAKKAADQIAKAITQGKKIAYVPGKWIFYRIAMNWMPRSLYNKL